MKSAVVKDSVALSSQERDVERKARAVLSMRASTRFTLEASPPQDIFVKTALRSGMHQQSPQSQVL